MSVTPAVAPRVVPEVAPAPGSSGVASACRAEWRKLTTQIAGRLVALVCVLGPLAFAALLGAQSATPADTLFGVWVHSSGFAVALVVLSFAGQWGFPVIAGVMAGDIFSSEDRYGTWKTILTRSCRRGDVFAGKLLAAGAACLGLLALTAVSSLVAGLVFTGAQPLVGLGGSFISAGSCVVLIAVSWLLCALPLLGFVSLAALLSIASRNGIIGVVGTALVALAMQLLALVGTGVWVHALLLASAFDAWHGLFAAHPYFGPAIIGCLVSVAWVVACISSAWAILRRRDFAGTPISGRSGWAHALRVAAGSVALVGVLAVASSWGPVGVTASRLRETITPAFNNLTLMQQRQLGRTVPPGTRLRLLSSCARRSGQRGGPGDDWTCSLDVVIPTNTGPTPFNTTTVTYDVSVKSNGCYKAEAPPSFVGQQSMRSGTGQQVVNPLFTIYGCFNTL